MAEDQQAAQAGNNINIQCVSIQPLPEFNPHSEVGEVWVLIGTFGWRTSRCLLYIKCFGKKLQTWILDSIENKFKIAI